MVKAFDYLGVVFRTCLAAFLFVAIQITVDVFFYVFSINREVYAGLFTTVCSLVSVGVFLLYHFIRSYKREKLIKFNRPNASYVVVGVVIAFGMLGLVSLYMIAAEAISNMAAAVQDELQQYNESMDRFTEVEKAQVPMWDIVLDFIGSGLLAPLSEELAFRGSVYGELRGKFNVVISMIASSLIFGILHGISIHIGYALICGMILALVYEFSGSIWLSFIVHAIFNVMGSEIYNILDSGLFGNIGSFSYDALTIFTLTEFVCIFPAIASLVLLGKDYKRRKKEAEVAA
ncbi:MAG: CPBP family intramembrane metalloprotease [Clostridiales bacterium]|nr:CPBP family intramembrane metalloprotease [Clostridiales bacterium]